MDSPPPDKKWYLDSRKWGLIGCAFLVLFVIVFILVLVYTASLPPAAANQNSPPP